MRPTNIHWKYEPLTVKRKERKKERNTCISTPYHTACITQHVSHSMYHTAHSTLTYNRRFRSRLRKLDGVGDVGYDEHLFIGCFKAYVGVYVGCLEVCSVYIWCIYMYNGCL